MFDFCYIYFDTSKYILHFSKDVLVSSWRAQKLKHTASFLIDMSCLAVPCDVSMISSVEMLCNVAILRSFSYALCILVRGLLYSFTFNGALHWLVDSCALFCSRKTILTAFGYHYFKLRNGFMSPIHKCQFFK